MGSLTVKDTTTQTDWKGTLSGTTISNMTLTGGTDQAYSAGAIVEITPTARWAKDLYDWAFADHSVLGAHEIATNYDPSNPTLETQKWVGVSSAVNEVTVSNATTGNGPVVSATGGDTNIGLTISPKGTGALTLNAVYNPYKFRVSRNAAANTGNGAFAVVAFDAEQFDTSNNVSAGVFTIPVTGFYTFQWATNATTTATGQSLAASLFKNGGESARGNQIYSSGSGQSVGSSGSVTDSFNAGETLDVRVFGSVAMALSVGSTTQCIFSGFLVSTT